jgi:polyisoprenyl-teichoic acid--peptidoglycan teichoic acid transferase
MDNNIKTKRNNRSLLIVLGVLALLGGVVLAAYFLWLRPILIQPLSEPFSLPTLVGSVPETTQNPVAGVDNPTNTAGLAGPTVTLETPVIPSNLPEAPVFVKPTFEPQAKPVCGDAAEWYVLLVGIDWGSNYLYGLADAIRVLRVDFVHMTVNMVAMPRDLIVEVPAGRFTAEGPFKLNQAYLFGSPGMGRYLGTGNGAASLAEVIQYNFGVTVEHYGVSDFGALVKFIDAIGGVDVDLPTFVENPPYTTFPSGKQHLTGERALTLARIRLQYSDAFRISNQTLILQAILKKLKQPEILIQIPGLINRFKGSFLTDLSLEQITSLGTCFLTHFDSSNLRSYQVPSDLLTADHAYIPSLSSTAFVYRWDELLVNWFHVSLLAEK